METPNFPFSFTPVKEGDILRLNGYITCRIQEGNYSTMIARFCRLIQLQMAARQVPPSLPHAATSLTKQKDNRMGCAEFTIPANTRGPPPHWHQMHDETFLVTQGQIRFHAKDGAIIDTKVGDVVIVPPRAPHTFENASNEESKFFNVFTPAYYIQYFKLQDQWAKEGKKLNAETVKKAMAYFATVGVEGEL